MTAKKVAKTEKVKSKPEIISIFTSIIVVNYVCVCVCVRVQFQPKLVRAKI